MDPIVASQAISAAAAHAKAAESEARSIVQNIEGQATRHIHGMQSDFERRLEETQDVANVMHQQMTIQLQNS